LACFSASANACCLANFNFLFASACEKIIFLILALFSFIILFSSSSFFCSASCLAIKIFLSSSAFTRVILFISASFSAKILFSSSNFCFSNSCLAAKNLSSLVLYKDMALSNDCFQILSTTLTFPAEFKFVFSLEQEVIKSKIKANNIIFFINII